MTALKGRDIQRFIDRPDLGEGVVLVYGPDAGLVRETAEKLAKHYAGPDGLGLTTLDGADLDADPGRLIAEARSASLFAEKRIVRLRDAGKSAIPPASALAEDPGGAIVIIEAGNLAPKDGLRALAEIAKLARALPCYPDSGEALQKLMGEVLAGIRLDPDAAATLRDTLGNDRAISRRELEKLALFAAESKVLTRQDILVLCADNAALALDEIADAIGGGRVVELETALARALGAAVNPQQILAGVGNHLAALRRWRGAVDSGASISAVLDATRPRPHFSRRASLEQQVRLWSDSALGAAAERVQTATAESRKTYALAETIARRALLSLARQAAEH